MKCSNCNKTIAPEEALKCDFCGADYCPECANSLGVCYCYGDFRHYS